MTNEEEIRQQCIAYLLGEAGPEEAEQVEYQLMADEAFFAVLESVESELYDNYTAGQLSEHQKELFRTRFLQDDANQEQLHFAKALHAVANAPQAAAVVNEKTEGWWARWLAPNRIAFAGAVVAALALLLIAFPRGDSLPDRITLPLMEQGLRGEQGIVRLPVAKQVVLRLPAPGQGKVLVRLLQGDRELSPPAFDRRDSSVFVTIEPADLGDGIYELELTSLAPGQTPVILGYYSFQIGA